MNELQRHIEILLLDNDCVIVPDFGGFVTHYISARYDENDHVFLPPKRTLGFNPQLRINDSLLVQSYVTAYDISYPEALRRIESEVEELKKTLETEGQYSMDDIGTLTVNSDGNYQFAPCEAGVLTPDLYGLVEYQFYPLKESLEDRTNDIPVQPVREESREETVTPALLEFTETESDGDRAIEIKMSWIRNAVAVAAAIAVFFLMATPIANSDLGTSTMSNLQSGLLQKLMPKDTNMTPATPVTEEALPSAALADSTASAIQDAATAVTDSVTSVQEVPASPRYCIVLASQVKRSNAEYYVEQLHKRGITDAEVYIRNHVVRVVCGAYETEAEAYQRLNSMTADREFAEAWVYKI